MKSPLKTLRTHYWKWKTNRSIRVIDDLDWSLQQAGYSRKDIRRFWREFVKHRKVRTEVLNKITQ